MKEELKFTNICNKESQKELIKEIMDLDAKDGLYEDDVEKLVSKEKAFDGVIVECTLYTEEQVREAIRMAWEADSIDGTVDLNIVLHYGNNNDLRTKWSEEEIIQSLKQPKKRLVMGDVQFNGTQEEWDALVEKNKKTQVSKKQTEISDEEIDNAVVKEYENVGDEKLFPNHTDKDIWMNGFCEGTKWYREQLRNKQNFPL